jgi:hypothetical protein
VKYKVTGQGTNQADMTFENENSDTRQQGGRPCHGRTASKQKSELSSTSRAQNNNDSGSVTCAISVDGTVVESNSSSGAYTICTASGSL